MQGEGAGNGLKEDGSCKRTVRNGGESSWYLLNYIQAEGEDTNKGGLRS